MRGFKRLLLGVFLLACVMVAVAFTLPRNISIARSVIINAPEADIFPYLNSLKKFNEWSPWAERDPETHYVFSGPAEGKGASMEWNSDKSDVGNGIQKITASVKNKSIEIALEFDGQGEATASYDLTPSGAGTKVVWGFETDTGNNPIARWMGLMFDRWIGADYEQGLAKLKEVVESKGVGH